MSQYRGFGPNDDLPDPKILVEKLRQNYKSALAILMVLLLVGLGLNSFFTVDPEEEAVVLRFGEPTGQIYTPGLHLKVPFTDRAYVVPVERQHRIEFGFRSTPGKVTTVNEQGFDRESLMLTGDLSLVHVRWSVLYKIKNIEYYLFKVKDQEGTIRDVSMGVMRQVIGDYSLDEVLTTKFREISDKAKALSQEALDAVHTGVKITTVAIRSSDVPTEAKQAFDDLNRSVAEVKRQLVEADAQRKRVRGNAKEQLKESIGQAEGRRSEIVGRATGEANAFSSKLQEFLLAPKITRQWMYLDAMRSVFHRVGDKIILDESPNKSGVVKLLPLTDLLGQSQPKGKAKKAAGPATKTGGAK